MVNAQGWKAPVDRPCTRLQQRMHFLRGITVHGVEVKFMLLFYHAVTESILRRGTAAWYDNLTVESKITDCPSGTNSYGDHGGQKPSTPQ